MAKMRPDKGWDTGVKPLYTPVEGQPAQVAAFMSGSGTNVRRVLEEEERLGMDSPFHVSLIVTDRPKRSNAKAIAEEYAQKGHSLTLVSHDIGRFYRERGRKKATLSTERDREIRAEYTDTLREKLRAYPIDFAVFGGFAPLTNITDDFPCLNVHPGDLSLVVDGIKVLKGLHKVPVQAALDRGLEYVRSSVILAMSYTGEGDDMDRGPLIALGPRMDIGTETDAGTIQDCLKEASDWKVLPVAVVEVARGNVVVDFRTDRVYTSTDGTGIIIPETTHINDYLEMGR